MSEVFCEETEVEFLPSRGSAFLGERWFGWDWMRLGDVGWSWVGWGSEGLVVGWGWLC